MSVPDFFREALDIRYTRRVVRKEVVRKWTQGRAFDFRDGYTLYSASANSGMNCRLCVQVRSAKPARYVENGRFDPGVVKFVVMTPSPRNGDGLIIRGIIESSQNAFVEFLRTGVVEAVGREFIDLFAPCPPNENSWDEFWKTRSGSAPSAPSNSANVSANLDGEMLCTE